MKLCNLIIDGHIRLGALVGDGHVNLTQTASRSAAFQAAPTCIEDMLTDWNRTSDSIRELIAKSSQAGDLVLLDGDFKIAAPVRRPGTFRDFYAFEEHVRNARKLRGLDINPEWYQVPVFYFSNPNTIKGPDEVIRFPRSSLKWDYELEVGAILGGGGSDLDPDAAEKLIAGFTILNDWSARDLQRLEMASSMGPAKGKDFATSIGPYLVTPDEFEDRRSGKGYDLRMTAKVNGENLSDNNWKTVHYSFGEMIARASQDASVYPGELFGSGTVGSGCLLERGFDHDLWLKPGNEVTLTIETFGRLSNRMI